MRVFGVGYKHFFFFTVDTNYLQTILRNYAIFVFLDVISTRPCRGDRPPNAQLPGNEYCFFILSHVDVTLP